MKQYLVRILILFFAAGGFLGAAETSIYQCDFTSAELAGWKIAPAFAKGEIVDGTPTLRVTVNPGEEKTQSTPFANRSIDLRLYRSKYLRLSCEAKAENVPPTRVGVKIMLSIETQQKKIGRNAKVKVPSGSFGWQSISETILIPSDATVGTIDLGLQASSGSVWFRNLKITVSEPAFTVPEGFRCAYTDRVKRMSPRRGVMSSYHPFNPEDMEELKRWNANLIRWQFNGGKLKPEAYQGWLDRKLEELDKVLDKCGELGISVVVGLFTLPGGRDDIPGGHGISEAVLYYNPVYRDVFYALWEQVAKRCKGHPAVWGYDLLNEPRQSGPTEYGYLRIQYEAAKRIRAIDPETPIIIESNNFSDPAAFRDLLPLPLPNIIYQAHMYAPFEYTHQGVRENLPTPVACSYDRKMLKAVLNPVREFEQKYGARIYIGEFSVARYAPGAAKYLEDVISIFEEYGWDWSYHAFRESPLWNVELDAAGNPAETDRKQVLLKAFQRNR